MAMTYGNVYVARVAMGANDEQTLKALPRGRGLRRAVAHHRLQPLHRARLSTCATGSSSRSWPSQRATGRCSATTRRCARPAATRSCSTRRGRASRWRTTSTTSRATARSPTPTRPRPSGCSAWPQQAVDQRWQIYEQLATRGAQRLPGRRAQGPLMDLSTTLPGPGAAQPAGRLGVAAVADRRRRPAPGGRRRRRGRAALAVRGADRARGRARTRGWPTPAPRASPSRCRTSRPRPSDDVGPRRYLELLERAAAAVDVPVIASLNGVTPGGWIDYARAMQEAGADALELNIYYLPGDPTSPAATSSSATSTS